MIESSVIAGSVVVLFIIIAIFRRLTGRRDPLPKRDPSCIWHSTVTKIDRVYDGDTLFAHVKGHDPIDKKATGIRIRGIDTPEIRDKRPAVKKKAQKAKAFVESEIRKAKKVHLYNISMKDKYGRMLANVFCDRKDIAKMLLEKRLAKRYDGGRKPKW
ncbi:MAG: hypothetical protein B6245_18075 [Desulfobacteraceae bacterium 4572_88]|nr:MAG: hypothetical protein B6245_18075 [Desulfobacteraceae bacterium 4572_88]RLB99709.1 MAG: thermonuclease family protein [Deltaproteobacteria bacterium]